jgi:L-rhamnonate dehydratase
MPLIRHVRAFTLAGADRNVPMFPPKLLDEPVPVNGRMKVPDRPRFGARLIPDLAMPHPHGH